MYSFVYKDFKEYAATPQQGFFTTGMLQNKTIQPALINAADIAGGSVGKTSLPQPTENMKRVEYMLTKLAKRFHYRTLGQTVHLMFKALQATCLKAINQ
ncbi:MAG: hypothetical protein JEY79_03225 [Pseudodesulfovibrio sp.]|nr:hypothetical protein [Pseudodesulfovibrio sp.]